MRQLNEGDPAPDFSVQDEQGNNINLSSYRGKKLILFFYPKANTPGCTTEACNLRDYHRELRDKGFSLLGVSADSQKKQQNFKQKHELPFPLIPDTEKEIINAYGVWAEEVHGKRI